MTDFQAIYLKSYRNGLLKKKIEIAKRRLQHCCLCPRKCNTDRHNPEKLGVCKTSDRARVSSYHQHFGEEAPLVGTHGSGTIFFTRCNLLCNFCQNFDISHEGVGTAVTDDQLASMMLKLQQTGCHNINFVSPSHVVPQILSALMIAVENGLTVPLVYNSSGYDRVETLKMLDGVIDIYMPDFKFWDPEIADAVCGAPDYPDAARKSITEMHRQVGDLKTAKSGLATRGLLIRHLVMPEGLAGTRDIMRFIATEISMHTYVNIMPQYRPCGHAHDFKPFARRITVEEYQEAIREAREEGITRLDQ